MPLVPDLSLLALRLDDDQPAAVGTAAGDKNQPGSSSSTRVTRRSKRALPQKSDDSGLPKHPEPPAGAGAAVPKTLVAKLLRHRGSNRDAWARGSREKLAGPPSFPATVRYLRDHTMYESRYGSIVDLSNFQHWDATNLLPAGLLCNEMNEAVPDNGAGWLAKMAPPNLPKNKGYYTRRDWGDKRVFVLGDVHGSLHSLLDVFLDMVEQGAFKTDGTGGLADDVAVVCLGDLLDRSPYTLECFYLMLRLCRENPEHCVLTAGNHETDKTQWGSKNGTRHEIDGEYNNTCPAGSKTFLMRMEEVTQALPSALIAKTPLGTLQFNHGSYEEWDFGSPQANAFLKFVNFEGLPDELETMGKKSGNPLQWADVGIKKAPPCNGRPVRDALAVSEYLKAAGLSMLVRGHSDLANLSLLYAGGKEPPQAVQDENAVASVSPDAKYFYYGGEVKDPRLHDKRAERANTFVRKAHDFTNHDLYDMHSLHEAPEADSFDKHLVTEVDGAQDLLVVTVASCPFSKPLPPVSMMSCYLAIGL